MFAACLQQWTIETEHISLEELKTALKNFDIWTSFQVTFIRNWIAGKWNWEKCRYAESLSVKVVLSIISSSSSSIF